jgi:hypothetical protein
MLKIHFILFVGLSMGMDKKMEKNHQQFTVEIQQIAEQMWSKHIKAKLPNISFEDPKSTAWQTSISDPIPLNWPEHYKLAFYLQARGMNLNFLKDGEYCGPVWGKITVDLNTHLKPTFVLITDKIQRNSIAGIRPLNKQELTILQIAPIQLFRSKSSPKRDQKLKTYYCLQKSLGNFPVEAIKENPKFFNWLNCDPQTSASTIGPDLRESPLTQAEAEILALEFLKRDGNKYQMTLVSEKTQKHDFGFVFFYAPKKYLETREMKDAAPGNGPLVVDFADRKVHPLPSSIPPEKAISEYKRNKK